MLVVALLSAYLTPLWAQAPQEKPSPQSAVIITAPADDLGAVQAFDDPKYKIQNFKSTPQQDRLIAPVLREKLFAESGLTSEVQSFDTVEKDILMIRVRTQEPPVIKDKYPQLSLDKIKKLKLILKRHLARQGSQ